MNITTKAIALRATDYKENDKLVLLYSLDYGKVTATAKGVRKSTAKLKYAVDQFCFGNYELTESHDVYTLTNCQQIESFYNLREDIISYYVANVVAECLINFTEEGEANGEIFVETLKALESLCVGTEPVVVAVRYLISFLELDGFSLDFKECSVCGDKGVKLFLDYEKGNTTCSNCRTAESISISPRVISVCNMVSGVPYDRLKNLSFSGDMLKETLTIYYKYLSHTLLPLKSLSELIKLI